MSLTRSAELSYINILEKELLAAFGCTEPISIAYAAAKARNLLGVLPDKASVLASGNIVKNVKGVIVPNSGGLKGIEAACIMGIVAGDDQKDLEVINSVTDKQKEQAKKLLDSNFCDVSLANSELVLDIFVTLYHSDDYVKLRVAQTHLNVVYIEKNGQVLLDKPLEDEYEENIFQMNVKDIFEFADTCDLNEIRNIIKRQIDFNLAISDEGLRGNWGANVGSSIMKHYNAEDVKTKAMARAAAGSDERMGGCEMPVIINSGSGNQGLTVSLPVIEYAKTLNASEDKLYRALILSNLLAIYQKKRIGRLSAYCGAVSAGSASGAAITYLKGGSLKDIEHTLVNSLAISSGIICDGAKPSCAGKIAIAVESGILADAMTQENQEFKDGEGIILKGVENTIKNVERLSKYGMKETDQEILNMMVEK